MKRMRFQTKLMLAVLLAVMLVTAAVISQTEKKVRDTYSRLAEEQFDEQVERFIDVRKSRIEMVAGSVERLAGSAQVHQVFETGNFGREELDGIESLGLGRADRRGSREQTGEASEAGNVRGAMQGAAERLVFLVDLGGTMHSVSRSAIDVPSAAGEPLRGLKVAEDLRTRQVGYLAFEDAGNQEGEDEASPETRLVEVIVAPVMAEGEPGSSSESGTGEVLGAVLVGQRVNLQGNERRSAPLQVAQDKTAKGKGKAKGEAGEDSKNSQRDGILGGSRRRLYSGILADGELFQGTLPDHSLADIEEQLADFLDESSSLESVDFDREMVIESAADEAGDPSETAAGVTGGGREHRHFRLFCERLNPGGVLPPAYQVVLIPMSQLHTDLHDLRVRGSGIGASAALFGLLLAWVFARRLARPIHDLERGTEQIRQGNFRARVPVRSEDEFGQLAESFNEMAGELEVKEQIRDLLGKVSDEAVAQALISGRLELGGETREVSILFCDIRGFSAMTETMNPGDVITLLNEHMTAMTEVVYAHHGVIDKFVGDEIMVIFGAPKSYGEDAANAARCALKLVERRQRLNAETGRIIDIGIGVASGDVVVGCMGSTDRLNYTVIGERVNRAARLCDQAEAGEVVIDESTWNQIADVAQGAERLRFKPKGYTRLVRAFRLDAMQQAERVSSPAADEEKSETAEKSSVGDAASPG